MNLYKAYETDTTVETDGVIIDYGPNSKGKPIQIRIARAGGANVRFAKILEHKTKPYKRAIANESLDEKIMNKIMVEAYADAVILDWTGVEDREGNAMSFSKENVIKLFTDLPELFRDIIEQSQKTALFRAEIREEEAGNSVGS